MPTGESALAVVPGPAANRSKAIKMTYTLHRLASGSYDLALDGVIVGSVVREVRGGADDDIWHAELLNDPPPEKRPPPFSKIDHTFGSL